MRDIAYGECVARIKKIDAMTSSGYLLTDVSGKHYWTGSGFVSITGRAPWSKGVWWTSDRSAADQEAARLSGLGVSVMVVAGRISN